MRNWKQYTIPPDTAEADWLPKQGLGSQAHTLAELGADSTYSIPYNPEWTESLRESPIRGRLMNIINAINVGVGGGNVGGFMPTHPRDLPSVQEERYWSRHHDKPDLRNILAPGSAMVHQMRKWGKLPPSERHAMYQKYFGGIPRLNRKRYDIANSGSSYYKNRRRTPSWYWRDVDAENWYLDSLRFAPNVNPRDYWKHHHGHQRYDEEIR